ncbi:MAG: efflux RND transporter periplasmic adaptor subunit [Anaerolineae bacterium]|nr:efflux RND transporter periplasmic adaptor subunit [Anaerolineae bacterium]
MYKRLRNLFYLGFLSILIAALARVYLLTERTTTDSTVQESAAVDRGDIILTVSATGSVQAAKETPLVFLSTSIVRSVSVEVGQRVLKGQTLAALDTQAAENALTNAQLALDLQKVAYNAIVAPARDVDIAAAQAAVAAAQAQLNAANISVDPLQLQIANLQIELAKNALWQRQLSRDSAVSAANQPPPDFLAQLYAAIWQLPPETRDQVLALLASISLGMSANSFGPSVNDAESSVKTAENGVTVAEAQAAATASQGGNPASVASAQLAVASAQATLDKLITGATPEQLALAQAQLEAAQAAINLARYNVERGTLLAPFDGIVAQINLAVNEPVPLNQPAIVLIDDSSFFVDVPVDEADIARVHEGQIVSLALDSLPGELITGKVQRVASTAVDLGSVVSYLVRVQIDGGLGLLRSGMTTTATITVSELHNVVRVRNRFVRLDRRTGKATVTVQRPDGKTEEIEVKLGLRNETYSEVISGLAEGDVVVVLPRTNGLF